MESNPARRSLATAALEPSPDALTHQTLFLGNC
jgi:hypothetical protein